jgi:hypothetical protein
MALSLVLQLRAERRPWPLRGLTVADALESVGARRRQTTLALSPVTEEEPFLYTDSEGDRNRLLWPALRVSYSAPGRL